MSATVAPAFRYIGTTDECIECQLCGKADLRSTVVLAILDRDGNVEDVTYYGSTCAARALGVHGGGRAVLQSARWAGEKTRKEAENSRGMLARYGADELGNFPTRGKFERAVTGFYRQYWNAAWAPQMTERADWAANVADLVAHHAANVAAARLLDR